MRSRLSADRLGARLGAGLTPLQVLACTGMLFFADWAFLQSGGSYFPGGPFDEAAHLMTALLLLQLLPPKLRVRLALPVLIASVAIDLDHIPAYLGFGSFSDGTPRPYAHSLLTPVLLLGLALAAPRNRALFVGLALGAMLHFFRDLAEGNGNGVSLLWPLSNHVFSYAHGTFLALMVCAAAADLCLAALRPRVRATAW